jgi:hypothetical protein
MKPAYLGDGIYIQPNARDTSNTELVLSSGSYILHQATEVIYMDEEMIVKLKNYPEEWIKSRL